ncbi:MAG: competence/damage-inducible protein A [Bacteroidetes bacterium]|nr:MAG: competence/damage-inducible protein A [Bacteroidota bacterium]
MKHVFAEILTIGDEILYGQITDTNSQWIGAELSKIGVKVARKTSVGDSEEVIVNAIESALQMADIVLVTGGLGPTKDDITKKTLAKIYQSEMTSRPEVLANIERLFASKGRVINDLNQMQALVPTAAEVVMNVVGTAPGMWFEKNGKVLVSMPGVPFEMKKMMTDLILPKLQVFFKTPVIYHRVIKTINVPESTLAKIIENWEDNLPEHIKLAYLPSSGQVKLRLTANGTDADLLKTEVQNEIEKLIPLIEKNIFGYDTDEIEQVVARKLVEKKMTISTAESCTGGFLAHQFTKQAGSSKYFKGGIVAYANEVKKDQLGVSENDLEEFGAVSEQVAKAMAENVRLRYKTDIGIATTGIAGPDGGSPEKPVGTVWIAFSDKNGTTARKLSLYTDRGLNIQITSNEILNWTRLNLLEN